MSFISVPCRPCLQCGKSEVITVWEDDYKRWQNGALIQDAFPNMLPPMRELLQSGTHPQCWLEIFGDEDGE